MATDFVGQVLEKSRIERYSEMSKVYILDIQSQPGSKYACVIDVAAK